jgi:dTMP kinase
MMRGLFVTFEGLDGSGKTTQAAILEKTLLCLGRKVRAIRDPGGPPAGEVIRHTINRSLSYTAIARETELLLFNAKRAQLTREIIQPALKA